MSGFRVMHLVTGECVTISSCFTIEEVKDYMANPNVAIIKVENKFTGGHRLVFSYSSVNLPVDYIPKYQFDVIEDEEES